MTEAKYSPMSNLLLHLCERISRAKPLQEGRQGEGVAAVLDTEDAEKQAVEDEDRDDDADDQNGLGARVVDAGETVDQGDDQEGQGAIY